jgi:hypothetical protein
MNENLDLISHLHRLAAAIPDEAPTLHAAAAEIIALRRELRSLSFEHDVLGAKVVPQLHKVLGALRIDPAHPEHGAVFRDLRRL